MHVTQIFAFPFGDPSELESLPDADMQKLQFSQSLDEEMSAFARLQATKPQNLAHALADSPSGQLT